MSHQLDDWESSPLQETTRDAKLVKTRFPKREVWVPALLLSPECDVISRMAGSDRGGGVTFYVRDERGLLRVTVEQVQEGGR